MQNGSFLILGGIKSGKTAFAINLAKGLKDVVYIATSIFFDPEMKRKIELHKKMRPHYWKTIEEGKEIVPLLKKISCEIGIIDCLGMLITNLLMDGASDKKILERIEELCKTIPSLNFKTILISNEVGCSIVPESSLSRRFCDLMGISNQMLAQVIDNVIFMQAGLPVRIK